MTTANATPPLANCEWVRLPSFWATTTNANPSLTPTASGEVFSRSGWRQPTLPPLARNARGQSLRQPPPPPPPFIAQKARRRGPVLDTHHPTTTSSAPSLEAQDCGRHLLDNIQQHLTFPSSKCKVVASLTATTAAPLARNTRRRGLCSQHPSPAPPRPSLPLAT
jgi:hypothetical protein